MLSRPDWSTKAFTATAKSVPLVVIGGMPMVSEEIARLGHENCRPRHWALWPRQSYRRFWFFVGGVLNRPVAQVRPLDGVRSALCNKYLVSRIWTLDPVAC
jgi:hypothetical protein